MSMDDNLNLFSLVDEEEKSAPNKKRGSKLDVVEMGYKQPHTVTWQECLRDLIPFTPLHFPPA